MRHQLENQEYIVNLTQQLVGKGVLEGLKRYEDRLLPHVVYRLLQPALQPRLDKMTAETLGRICSYGRKKNFSEPLEDWSPSFIQKIGIEEVVPPGEDERNYGSRAKSGWQIMRDLAVATIVSVACDITLQAAYDRDRKERQEANRQFQKGLEDYIHRGHPNPPFPRD